ncbi:MAG: acetate/propionate family kinase [Pseudomonadota bacterium]|nr:acetate/propionate family kinase [Pseudomonadota bacterium]MEE3069921.1 acetate/propionate family kinase [Pseudomonadota bacterium]
MSILMTLNAGSSSIKFAVYPVDGDHPIAHGQLEKIGSDDAQLTLHGGNHSETRSEGSLDHTTGLRRILAALDGLTQGAPIAAVGHRIVHGGPEIDAPKILDSALLEKLAEYAPLAPLHQPHNLAAVHAAIAAFPDALQVGCFDTAFHRHHPWVNDTFALPRTYYDQGVRRYGFHGLSYDYIIHRLAQIDSHAAHGKTVVAHLGNGASMCAIRDGRSIGSTMGFSALDGLPMGTRSGQIDPGVLLYLMESHGMDAAALTDLLYKKSGLLGLSGLSNDMRTLEEAGTDEAEQAIAYFTFRIRRELGAMAAILGGVDTLVFCGGIGEHSARIRAEVCTGMEWLGIALDAAANAAAADIISNGPTKVRVIPTDEEAIIAKAVRSFLAA